MGGNDPIERLRWFWRKNPLSAFPAAWNSRDFPAPTKVPPSDVIAQRLRRLQDVFASSTSALPTDAQIEMSFEQIMRTIQRSPVRVIRGTRRPGNRNFEPPFSKSTDVIIELVPKFGSETRCLKNSLLEQGLVLDTNGILRLVVSAPFIKLLHYINDAFSIPIHALLRPARPGEGGIINERLTLLGSQYSIAPFRGGESYPEVNSNFLVSCDEHVENFPHVLRQIYEKMVKASVEDPAFHYEVKRIHHRHPSTERLGLPIPRYQ